ncbi:hypothetical protein [Actinokineospora pegani]|uniref:hypothetical protein n=1 Tax=Actinokineospora pegani TaxID=2654637 RepID=UPI0012E9E8C6|nr:hypothetical protein [Actinokineospora pegani]
MPPTPTTDDVARIAAHPDPVLRNLMITHCYHELSLAMAHHTRGTATWCTFAVWASKQVGQTIRQEDPHRLTERLLATTPLTRLATRALPHALPRGVRHLAHRAIATLTRLDTASTAAAAGNLKVFTEIAHEFARFLTEFADETTPDHTRLAAFRATLRPGPPPEGQDHLANAFTRYHHARHTDDPRTRAELILLANIEIGPHEQTRLQPEIAAALAAPIPTHWPLLRHIPFPTPLHTAADTLTNLARTHTRRAITTLLMTLTLPDTTHLDLSDDLTTPFPPPLAHLTNPELLALLHQVDPTPDNLADTAARDWSDLPDRMHYIADMFRCYATHHPLLTPPFTPDQVAALTAGHLPTGRL